MTHTNGSDKREARQGLFMKALARKVDSESARLWGKGGSSYQNLNRIAMT